MTHSFMQLNCKAKAEPVAVQEPIDVPQSAEELYKRALAFRSGRGVERDREKAVEFYTRAANAGSVEAMFELGHLYKLGNFVPKSERQARRYFEMAYQAKHPSAAYELARLLEYSDKRRATHYLCIATQEGNKRSDAISILRIRFGGAAACK